MKKITRLFLPSVARGAYQFSIAFKGLLSSTLMEERWRRASPFQGRHPTVGCEPPRGP